MAESILQSDPRRCYLCGKPGTCRDPLDKHHVFFGANRSKSEKYGLTVYIHHFECHIFGENAVHRNVEICSELQEEAQKIAMFRYGWTVSDFIALFGRSYC